MDDREILKDAGKITAQFAKNFAESENANLHSLISSRNINSFWGCQGI